MTIGKIQPFNYKKYAQDNTYEVAPVVSPVVEEVPAVYTPKVPVLGPAKKKTIVKPNQPQVVAPNTLQQKPTYNPNRAAEYLKRVIEVEDIDEFDVPEEENKANIDPETGELEVTNIDPVEGEFSNIDKAKFYLPKTHFKKFFPPVPWVWQNDNEKIDFANFVWDRLINPNININPQEISNFLTKIVGPQYAVEPVNLTEQKTQKEVAENTVIQTPEERAYTPEQLEKRKINELTQNSSIHAQMYMQNQSQAMQELLGRDATNNEELTRLQAGFGAAVEDFLSDQKKYLYFSRHDEMLPQDIRVEFSKANINPKDKNAFNKFIEDKPQLKSRLDEVLSHNIKEDVGYKEGVGNDDTLLGPLERDLFNRAFSLGGSKAGGLQLGQMGAPEEGGVAGNVGEGEKPIPLEPLTQADVDAKRKQIDNVSYTITPRIQKVSEFAEISADAWRRNLIRAYKILKYKRAAPEQKKIEEQKMTPEDKDFIVEPERIPEPEKRAKAIQRRENAIKGFTLTGGKIEQGLLDADTIDMAGNYMLDNLTKAIDFNNFDQSSARRRFTFKAPDLIRGNLNLIPIIENGEIVDFEVPKIKKTFITKQFKEWYKNLDATKQFIIKIHKRFLNEGKNLTAEEISYAVKSASNEDFSKTMNYAPDQSGNPECNKSIVDPLFVESVLILQDQIDQELGINSEYRTQYQDIQNRLEKKDKYNGGVRNTIVSDVGHKIGVMLPQMWLMVNKNGESKKKYTPEVMRAFFSMTGIHKKATQPFETETDANENPIMVEIVNPKTGQKERIPKIRMETKNGKTEPVRDFGGTTRDLRSFGGGIKTYAQMYYDLRGDPFPEYYLNLLEQYSILREEDVQDQKTENKEIRKRKHTEVVEASVKDKMVYGIYSKYYDNYAMLDGIRNSIKHSKVIKDNVKVADINVINIVIGDLLKKTQKALISIR